MTLFIVHGKRRITLLINFCYSLIADLSLVTKTKTIMYKYETKCWTQLPKYENSKWFQKVKYFLASFSTTSFHLLISHSIGHTKNLIPPQHHHDFVFCLVLGIILFIARLIQFTPKNKKEYKMKVLPQSRFSFILQKSHDFLFHSICNQQTVNKCRSKQSYNAPVCEKMN